MKKLKLFLTISLMILIVSSISLSQAVGDYGSAGSGNWGSNGANWVVCQTAGTWAGATPAPGAPSTTTNVWIRSGHTVVVEASPKNCNNITIESGAKLWANVAKTTVRYLRIYGTQINNNGGTFGGENDGLSIGFYQGSSPTVISGSGTYYYGINRMQPNAAGVTIVFDADARVTYAGTGGTGGSAIYNNGFDNLTVTINAGKTLAMDTLAYISVGTSGSADPGTGYNITLNVNGTLVAESGAHINLRNASSKTSTLNIGSSGVLSCNGNLLMLTGGTATFFANIDSGGVLNFPSAVTCNLSGATVTLNGNLSVSPGTTILGNVILNNKITLGNYNLDVAGSITGASASNYIVTNGTGVLRRYNVGNTDVLFPVGTVSSYNPVTINNAGTVDNFSVRVKSSFDNPPVYPNKVVNRQWTITEAVAGGSNATITFQWNAADEASGFDRIAGIEIGHWTGTQWQGLPAVFAGGSDPYSAYVGNVSSFSDFSVGNEGALPIQLASFIGNIFATGKVKLEWQTISEKNNAGFYVEKYNSLIDDFVTVSELIPGAGTTLQPQSYSWVDENAVEVKLQYRLKQMDMNGLYSYFGPIMLNPTGVIDNSVPAVFALHQNYPNPFNPSTTIKFSLAEANYTTLKVYNILGSEVATLFDRNAEAGKLYSVKLDGSDLSSGIYFCRLQSGNNVEVRKLTLMK